MNSEHHGIDHSIATAGANRLRARSLDRRSLLKTAAAGSAAAVGLVGGPLLDVGMSPASAQSDLSNIAVIGYGNTPISFDPAAATDSQVDTPSINIYSALVQHKVGTTEIEPDLATSWEVSEDGLTWTFQLREGITFHDGAPFTSADVVYTFDRILGLKRGVYQNVTAVDSVEAPEPLVAVVHLSSPFPAFDQALTRIYIVNSALVQSHVSGDDFGEAWLGLNDAGSGPYQLTDFAAQQQFTITKFDNYWRGWDGNHVDGAIFQAIPEETARRLALENGQVDWSMVNSVDTWNALQGNPDIQAFSAPTLTQFYFALNHNNEYLQDPNVRQALSLVYDYVSDVDIVRGGQAEIARGAMPSQIPFFNEDIGPQTMDVDKAKEYMAQSAWPDGGFSLEIAYQGTNPQETTSIQILQAGAAEVGIEIVPVAMEWSAKVSAFSDPATAPPMATIWIYPPYPDPYNFFFPLMDSSNAGNGGVNFSFYANDDVDTMIETAGSATDEQVRADTYGQLQEIFVSEVPYVPVVVGYSMSAGRQWLQGYQYSPTHNATINIYALSLDGKP